MFSKWLRIVLLTLVLIVVDNVNLMNQASNIAYAQSSAVPLGAGKANHPSCESAGVIVLIMSGVTAALVTLYAGYALFLAPEPISTATGVAMITAAMGALTGIVVGSAEFFACTHGFIRHPVLRWENTGGYKTCRNPEQLYPGQDNTPMVCKSGEYVDTSDYEWPKNKASYSEYVEVCHRYALVPFPVFNIGGLDDREYEFGLYGDFTEEEIKDGKKDDIINMKEWVGWPDLDCETIKVGQIANLNGISFKAYQNGGKICVDAVGLFGGEFFLFAPVIGCQSAPPAPPAPMCEKSVAIEFDDRGRPTKYNNTACFNCYISGSCYSQISLAARAPFPITSVVVQCIRESLENLVTGECSAASGQSSSGRVGFLAVVQERLKSTVMVILVLSVALFGIKMILGHAIQGPAEYFILLLKFAFVVYFSIGNGMQIYYSELIRLSTGLADLVLSASGSAQVCNYDSNDYQRDLGNGLQDYSYLAPWDRLDCRISFYLGNGFAIGAGAASAAAVIAAATLPVFGVLLLVIPCILAGQLLIAICVAFYIFMLVLTIVWMVHLFVLSLIALTIISIFAPLFVPMVLFQATKGFFDGWLKQLMAYSIYPIILFAFLSLLFSVFDHMYFKNLEFRSQITNKEVKGGTRTVESFIPEYEQCTSGTTILACLVANIKHGDAPLILGIKVTKAEIDPQTKDIWKDFGMMGLMAFLFYHFLGVIGGMAAELSGNFRADLSQRGVNDPKQMAAKLEASVMKVADVVGSTAKSGAQSIKRGVVSKGKGGQGSETMSESSVGKGGGSGS